jgi:hypothetical protein
MHISGVVGVLKKMILQALPVGNTDVEADLMQDGVIEEIILCLCCSWACEKQDTNYERDPAPL